MCTGSEIEYILLLTVAITAAIRAVNANYEDGVDGMQVEIDEFGKCFGTPEFVEGTTAFVEKRKAEFRK